MPQPTISPWAKLTRPVVPKIRDRPIAAMAMNSPNLMPSTVSWSTCRSRYPTAPAGGSRLAGREGEDGRPGLPGFDAHRRRVAIRCVEDDPLGQGGVVEQYLIGARFGDLEEEHPFGVGGAGADLVAGGVGDRERHPLDRLPLTGIGVLHLQRRGDRLGVLGEDGADREDEEQARRDDQHHDSSPPRHPGPFSRSCGTALAGQAH